MKISKKLKIKILAMFAVFIFSALLGVYLFWKSTLPVYDGRLHLIGLKHPVIVRRDSWGIPHIEAQTEQDVFMAMGYVVAQDRFWQMEFMRRLMTGRLSEMAGSSTLPLDRLMRIVGIKQQVEKEVSDLAPPDRTLIRAYCQGVNQFIESGRLPVECYIFGIEPQPWTEADVLLIPKLLAFWLTWWQTDVFLGAIQSHIDEERFHELMPYYPGDAPSIIPADSLDRLQSARRPEKHDFSATVDPRVLAGLAMFNDLMGRGTSNSWVISGEKTTSGKPLLANDPHLILALPSNFYEIHLLTPQLDVYGQTVPGAPGVVIGHNRAISWGLTNGMLDDADLFIEKINPDNSDEYLDGQLWRPVEVRPETILVKGEKPVVLEVKKTRHGPIISGELENTSQVLSFSWMGYRQGQEIGSILACGYAADWADFRAAVSAMTCPALNLVYADTSGNIGYQFCGKIPLRRNGIGRFPHPAWSGAYDWIGVVP
ncbi:MAG: penicillin acylase family protein, partial [Planctomycetes bacterium]|nr:penicillin acylase family protein [Planctomycetota bacterium]